MHLIPSRCARFRSLPVPALAAAALAAATLLAGCTKSVHQSDFFYPRPRPVLADDVGRRNVEMVARDSTRLGGWYLQPAETRGTLIYFYGNGASVHTSDERLFWLASALHLNVLCMDYRGYGYSEGKPTFAALDEDALAEYDRVVAELDLSGRPVMAYGVSLGSAVAVNLASRRKLAGLILEGSFPSAEDAIGAFHHQIPWYARWFVHLRLDTDLGPYAHMAPVETLSHVATPLLVIHGEEDTLFPLAFGRRMYDASPAETRTWCPVPGANHNTVLLDKPPVSDALAAFFDDVAPREHAAPRGPLR